MDKYSICIAQAFGSLPTHEEQTQSLRLLTCAWPSLNSGRHLENKEPDNLEEEPLVSRCVLC